MTESPNPTVLSIALQSLAGSCDNTHIMLPGVKASAWLNLEKQLDTALIKCFVDKPHSGFPGTRFQLSESVPYPTVDRLLRTAARVLPQSMKFGAGGYGDRLEPLFEPSISDDLRPLVLMAIVLNLNSNNYTPFGYRRGLAVELLRRPRLVRGRSLSEWAYDQLEVSLRRSDVISICYNSDERKARLDLIESLALFDGSSISLQEELTIFALHKRIYSTGITEVRAMNTSADQLSTFR
jgi:hypothetical protein